MQIERVMKKKQKLNRTVTTLNWMEFIHLYDEDISDSKRIEIIKRDA